jgi:hypothetical protein
MQAKHFIVLGILTAISWADTTIHRIVATTDSFTITLPETPSTGYTWYLQDFNSALIHPVSKVYEGTKTPGAPGKAIWTFSHEPVPVPISTTLTFSLTRSFGDEAAIDEHETQILLPAD